MLFALFLAFTWSLTPDFQVSANGPLGGLYGGGFVIAVEQDTVFTLSPNASPDDTSMHIIDLLYDPLARTDPETLLPVPWVADGWTVDETNQTVLVTLRNDVTWHDGTPITASDVLWTYSGIYPATEVSGTEVLFNLSSSNEDGKFFTEGLALPLIEDGDNSPSEGCGAFTLDSQNASEVVVSAYDDYFAGRPYLNSITFRKYPGFDEAADAIIAGEVGLIGWTLGASETSVLLQNENVTLLVNPTFKFLYTGVNTQKAPLDDSVIRKAIAMSTDKDLYLSIESNTIIADSVINPANSYWLNSTVPRYRVKSKVEGGESKPDLDAVKIMLDEAGYTDKDSDGLREKPDGSEFSFEFLYPSSGIELQKSSIALNLIDKLQTIGIDVQGVAKDTWADLYNDSAGNFDIFMGVLDTKTDPSFIRDILHTSGSDNLVRYSDTSFDQVLECADAAISMTQRRDFVMYAQGWIAEENPISPILHYEVIEAVNKSMYTGWVNMADGVYNYWSLTNLHLTQGDPPRVSVIILADQVSSGEVMEIEVQVQHPVTFDPMPDVFVMVEEVLEPGITYNGYTDSTGSFVFNWTVPTVTEPATAIFNARTVVPGFPDAFAGDEITVHPGAGVLRVAITRNPSRISSGGLAHINVTVRDWQTLAIVPGAEVTIQFAPEGLEGVLSNPSGVTDANGVFYTRFTAEVSVDTSFLIVAEASMTGYADGADQTAVFVDRAGGTAPDMPALDSISLILVVVAVALGCAYLRRRPKRK